MSNDHAYFDRHVDQRMNYALLGILLGQLGFVLGVLLAVGADTHVILLLTGLVFAGNFANVYLLTYMFWKPLERRWPTQPVHEGALTRGFQTFWFGPIARYNMCVHATVDHQHIHITPMAPMRWIGSRVVSLPLDDMVDYKRTAIPLLSEAKIGKRRIVGPTWCMQLAQSDEDAHA